MKLAKCKKLLASALAAALVLAPMGEIPVRAEDTEAQTAESSRVEAEDPDGTKAEGQNDGTGTAEESVEANPGVDESTEALSCDKTDGCILGAGHEGDCVAEETEKAGDAMNKENTSEENGSEEAETLSEEAGKAVDSFGGSGTAEQPYIISSAEDLKLLAQKVNGGDPAYNKAYYQLTADIDLVGSAENQWTPIGTNANPFAGTFIGTDFTISGLYIDDPEMECAGLFGKISSPAKLVGITVSGATVHGKSNVGTIAGSAFTGTVENCKVIGQIDVSGNYMVGGMFGSGYASIIDSSVEAAEGSTVSGIYKATDLEGDNVGGLIGFRGEGSILTENCSVSGVTVAGTRKVGGVIGSAFTNNRIEGCKVGNIEVICNATKEYGTSFLNSSAMAIGGIIGLYTANGNNDGTLKNCTVENVSLEVENAELAATDKVVMGYVSGGQRYNKAPAETIQVENITVTGNNSGSNAEEKFPGSVAMNGEQKLFANGTGTVEDPYILSSVEELKKFANSVNKTGITYQDQYIKIADGVTFDLTDGIQIGSSSKRFMGTFEGNGATVTGLTNSLFGGIQNATIKNLKLVDVNITGEERGALLSGNTKWNTKCFVGTNTIDNIEVSGTISGEYYVGGIIGGRATMEDSDVITIKNCVNRATITATGAGKCGGIVGFMNSTVNQQAKGTWKIENCTNYGNITSKYWAGGITGGTGGKSSTVSSCINEGQVQGADVTGGIIGTANSGTTVASCINNGDITDAAKCAGGIIGSSSSGGNTVSKSANTGNVTGVTNAGGIIGGTSAAGDGIDNCYNGGDITATGDRAVAAGIFGYNNPSSPIKACINDGKITAPNNGTVYQIGVSNYWYDQATGSKIATCFYIDENGKIYAVAEDGKDEAAEQKDMTRTELAEILNQAGGVAGFWQAQNGSVQPDPLIPGAFDDTEKRVALILDKDGNEIEGYTSLEAAVGAVQDGQTVVLEKDVILDDALKINGGKAFTLDLKGKTITLKDGVKTQIFEVGDKAGTDLTQFTLTDTAEAKGGLKSSANSAGICVRTGASMTIKDVTIDFEDKDESAANAAIQVQGTLTVEEGTKIDSTEYGITVIGEGAALVVNSGNINARYSAVSGNGTMSGTEITVNGGELNSTESTGIYHPQNGKLMLNGGTITGLTGVQMCAGSLEIPKDSTVKVVAVGEDGRTEKGAGDGPIDDGAAISIVNREYPGGAPHISISGGTFVAEKTDHVVLAYTWNANAPEGEMHSEWSEAGEYVAVSGGVYNKPIAEELLEDGFALNEPDKDGNYTIHQHVMTMVDKKDATCTETGISRSYYKCDTCEKCFEDELGESEITETDSLVIPAKGHHYVDGKCTVCGAILGEKPEDKPDSKPEENPDNKPEENPDSKPEENPDNKPEENPDSKPEENPDNKPGENPDNKPEENPDNKPDNKPGNNDPGTGKPSQSQNGQNDKAAVTGDSANIVLWIIVLVIASGAVAGSAICLKRRKNK